MEERRQGHLHGSTILGGKSGRLRGSFPPGGGWCQKASGGGLAGDAGRVAGEMERGEPHEAPGGRSLPSRLSEDIKGWGDPREQAPVAGGPRREGLDEELRRNGRSRRRVGCLESERRRRRQEGGRRSKGQREESELKPRVIQEEEEEEKGQEKKERRRGRSRRRKEGSRHQGLEDGFWEDGVGSQCFGEKKDDEAGQEGGEKEGQEGQQLYIGEHRLRGVRYAGGRGQQHLRRGGSHQDSVESSPRSFDDANPQPDAAVLSSTAVGAQPKPGTSNFLTVLEDVPVRQSDGPHESRDPVHLLRSGLAVAGPHSSGLRRPDAEAEKPRTNLSWRRLENIATAGGYPLGCGQPLDECGNFGRVQAASGRNEGQGGGTTMGAPWKRRLRFLGCQRKRKRQGQGQEGQQRTLGKEQGRRREGWKGERKVLRTGLEDDKGFEAESRRNGDGSRGNQGREYEPTRIPPMRTELQDNEMPERHGLKDQKGPEGVLTDGFLVLPPQQLVGSFLQKQPEKDEQHSGSLVSGGCRLRLEGLKFGLPTCQCWGCCGWGRPPLPGGLRPKCWSQRGFERR